MKKIISCLLILTLLLCMVGCFGEDKPSGSEKESVLPSQGETNSQESSHTQEERASQESSNTQEEITSQESSDTQGPTVEVTAKNPYTKYDAAQIKLLNGLVEPYYVDHEIELNAETMIASYVLKAQSSEEFRASYQNASKVEMLPIFGVDLEYTSLALCLFYSEDTLTDVRLVTVGEDKGQGSILKEMDKTLSKHSSSFGDESLLNNVSRCFERTPDFNVIGIVFDDTAWGMAYLIGTVGADPTLGYYWNEEWTPFGLVKPFTSIEEGQEKFEEFWISRAQLKSSIPVFEWENEFYTYIRQYALDDVLDWDWHPFLQQYEWYEEITLLDPDGNEDSYVLYLLYYQDVLLAELLLDKIEDESGRTIVLVHQNVSPKDAETGEYVGLSESQYITEAGALLRGIDDYSNIKGISFDGEKYFLIEKN